MASSAQFIGNEKRFKPFLLLASRNDDTVADDEYDMIRKFSGLHDSEIHRVRMESSSIPNINLEKYSGVIVGGGPFNSSDSVKSPLQQRVEKELAPLLDEIVDQDFPFLGICYGVGTLGAHQGAQIDATYSEPVTPIAIELTDEGERDPILAGVPRSFHAFVGHKEAVRELPDHAVLLATSQNCPVQMFRIKNNLYATQFHPELDLDGIITRIKIYKNHGYFPPETADEVIATVSSQSVWAPHSIIATFVRRYAKTA